MTIARVKRPYTIAFKYLTSQANLPWLSRKLHLLRTALLVWYGYMYMYTRVSISERSSDHWLMVARPQHTRMSSDCRSMIDEYKTKLFSGVIGHKYVARRHPNWECSTEQIIRPTFKILISSCDLCISRHHLVVFDNLPLICLTTTLLTMINVLVGQQKLLITTCYTVQTTLYREEIL